MDHFLGAQAVARGRGGSGNRRQRQRKREGKDGVLEFHDGVLA